MTTRIVIVGDIRSNDLTERFLAEHNHMIQALSTNGTDEPFDIWGLPGRARSSEDFGDQHVCGLPPEGIPSTDQQPTHSKKDFREPHLETPAEVQEEKPFEPVKVPEHNRGIVDSIRAVASTLVKKVQRLIRPIKRAHKEVIINAETLETRVPVLEEGRLEEFNIERTTEERLVGSIFKGKVRNLEDGNHH